MTSPIAGGVDCDLHPAVPHLTSLLPYLNDYWRDQVTTRGMVDLVSQSYPANSPITSRPDWRPSQGKPGSSLDDMKRLHAESTEWLTDVDLLINNAGVAVGGAVGDVPIEDWQWITGINQWGVIYGCKAFLPRVSGCQVNQPLQCCSAVTCYCGATSGGAGIGAARRLRRKRAR